MILGVSWFWKEIQDFNERLFIIGICASIIASIGTICVKKAISEGPIKPISALISLSNVLLLVFEANK
jgi:hypothetical protein